MSSVFVCGHARSGTSMVAGLLAEHGVFFGRCHGATSANAKGFFENRWLKKTTQGRTLPAFFSVEWRRRLREEGWDGERPWGAKMMAMHWPRIRRLEPTIVVCVHRDPESIIASSEIRGWPGSFDSVERAEAMMALIRDELPEGNVFDVYAPDLVDGRYRSMAEPIEALGIEFDSAKAARWIDPELWHYRPDDIGRRHIGFEACWSEDEDGRHCRKPKGHDGECARF